MFFRNPWTSLFIGINAVGVLTAILWLFFGEKSGSDIEGFCMSIFYTHVIVILFGVLMLLFNVGWWSKNLWGVVFILLYSPVTFIVSPNLYHNFTSKQTNVTEFGIVDSVRYEFDVQEARKFLLSSRMNSVSIDTIIYHPSLRQFIAFGYDSTADGYRNIELFGRGQTGRVSFSLPSGGNLFSYYPHVSDVMPSAMQWYYRMYDNESLWSAPDLWR